MENGPFEGIFPIQNGIFHCYVGLPEGKSIFLNNVDLGEALASSG